MIRLTALLCAVGVSSLVSACTRSDGTLTLLPAAMRIVGPNTKEALGAVALWGNSSLESEIRVRGNRLGIRIVARGTLWDGEWPKLYITLDGRVVASLTIDSAEIAEYAVQVEVPHAERSRLKVAVVNYVATPGKPIEGRNLLVEKIVVLPVS